MYKIDYHTHAKFSFDSTAEYLDQFNAAKKRGINDIIFTEHCECNLKSATPPGVPIRPLFDHEGYWNYIKNFRATSGLDFGIGLELGQANQEPERAKAVLESHEWDFIICSLHNMRDEYDFSLLNYHERDVEKTFSDYLSELYEIAEQNLFCVLGHIYYPLRYIRIQGVDFDHTKFDAEMAQILKLTAQNGKGIEINISSKSYDKSQKDRDFILRYVKMFRDLGGEIITTGSDGHNPDAVGQNITDANEILKEAGFKYISKFRKRKPTFEKI